MHLFAIPVVGRDDAFSVEVEQLRDNSTTAFINRFDRFDPGFDDTGVTDHIGIGKIQDDQIKFTQAREKLVGHFKRAHFRLQIVSGDFR